MKNKLLLRFTAILFIMFNVLSVAQTEKSDVDSFVNDYLQNLNTNNTSGIVKVIHEEGAFFGVNAITNKTVKNSAEEYIELIKTGRLGGWNGTATVNHVSMNTNIASADIQITNGRLKQTQYLTLLKTDDGWKVVNATYSLSKDNS